jgi:hypothetical protein
VSSVSPSALSHARQEAIIGLLSGNRFEEHELAAIRAGLAEFGLIEARNVAVEYRSADGQYGRLPALAAELVRRPVAARRLTTRSNAGARRRLARGLGAVSRSRRLCLARTVMPTPCRIPFPRSASMFAPRSSPCPDFNLPPQGIWCAASARQFRWLRRHGECYGPVYKLEEVAPCDTLQ